MTHPIDLTGRPTPMPPDVRELVRDSWRHAGEHIDPLEPVAPLGLDELRRSLSRVLGSDPDHILVTSGVRAVAPVLGDRLRHTTVEVPGFADIAVILRCLGYEVEQAPWDRFTGNGGAAWLTHPGRNPDGATLTPAEWQLLQRGDWRCVVINETYRWFDPSPNPDCPSSWYLTGSLHKLVGPGARLGWLRGTGVASLATPTQRISAPSPVAQLAWSHFLDQDGVRLARAALDEVTAAKEAFRVVTAERLVERRAGVGPSLLAALPAGCTTADGVARLATAGVAANSGEHFGASEPSVRLCFNTASVAQAQEAGRRFLAAL